MASSLIRGKYVIARATSRTDVSVIENGAVFQRDGTIVEIGRHEDLAPKYAPDTIVGSAGHVVIIGGGATSALIAVRLTERGFRVTVLEKAQLGNGSSSHSAYHIQDY